MSRRQKLLTAVLTMSVLIALVVGFWPRTTIEEEYRRGWSALNRGAWAEAAHSIERLRQRPGSTNHERILRAGLLLRTGDPRSAITELSRVRAAGDLREQSLLLLCEALYQLKRWIDAEKVARELLRIHADHPEAHRWLAMIYYDLGALSQAEIHLHELARLAPNDYSPHRLLGVIHKDFERYKEAADDFQQALLRHPPTEIDREIRTQLAAAQIKLNQFDEALKTLADQSAGDDIDSLTLRAECMRSTNRKDEALTLLQLAQRKSPDDPQVLWQAARLALDDGRTHDALSRLQQIVRADPFDHLALYELSLVHRRLDNLADADQFLERRNTIFALLKQMVDLNQRAINESTNASLREELALVCEQLGKKDLAQAWRDAAAALKSTSHTNQTDSISQ